MLLAPYTAIALRFVPQQLMVIFSPLQSYLLSQRECLMQILLHVWIIHCAANPEWCLSLPVWLDHLWSSVWISHISCCCVIGNNISFRFYQWDENLVVAMHFCLLLIWVACRSVQTFVFVPMGLCAGSTPSFVSQASQNHFLCCLKIFLPITATDTCTCMCVLSTGSFLLARETIDYTVHPTVYHRMAEYMYNRLAYTNVSHTAYTCSGLPFHIHVGWCCDWWVGILIIFKQDVYCSSHITFNGCLSICSDIRELSKVSA